MTAPAAVERRPVRQSWAARLVAARLIPKPIIGRQLAGISFLDAVGSGMYYTGSALYFVRVVGLSPGQVGAGLSLGGIVGLLGTVPVGTLADRFRAGRVYVGLQLTRGICYTAFCFVASFPLFALVAACIGVTDSAIPPVHQAVVGATVAETDRVDTLAKIRAVRNAGFGLGAVTAVVAIGLNSRPAFLILIGGNALSYFVVTVLLRAIGMHRVAATSGQRPARAARPAASARYAGAAGLNGILAVHSTALTVAMPLWLARYTVTPPPVIGGLIAANTAIAVVFQARLSRRVTSVPRAARAGLRAGLSLTGFAVACQFAHLARAVWLAVACAAVGVVLLTLAELWQSASAWTIAYELADPDRRASYLSAFQVGTSLQVALAPWLITNIVFPTRDGWLLFGLVSMLAGTGIMVMMGRFRGKHRA
jgi:hypothetical protein